ncbi:MAG: WD40 repeat domain-containing serine/threonine protein kinase [Planctomycetota bacterium]
MDPDEFESLRALYERAAPLAPPARARLLEAECAGRPALRDEVERMLRVDGDERFLERPEALDLDRPDLAELPERVGPYQVLGRLGEGGSSVVLRARQESPIHRTVALKVLRASRIDERARRRFQGEGDLLAGLAHGGIAHVYDAGETEDGQLFLAMELVEGAPITTWCDERRIPLDARLGLFERVVEAVQYAHQNGVVHRDVKSANVLVQGGPDAPRVKLIDFGIARPVERSGLRALSATWDGTILGTPASMSPEQASGNGVDTRTDVYGLGALLYELCTGTPPLAVSTGAPVEEILRSIREEDPLPLARAARSAPGGLERCAKLRGSAGKDLLRDLEGDLAWVMRAALAKDPDDRYPTARALGDDVQRAREGAPVHAREPALRYLAGRFVRRHRLAFGLSLAALAVVVATILGLAWALRSVDSARRTAEGRGEEAKAERAAAVASEYAARIAAAGAALDAGDATRARAQLESAPTEHRGWEWSHLVGQLDSSAGLIQLEEGSHHLWWLDERRVLVLHVGAMQLVDVVLGRSLWRVEGGSFDDALLGPEDGTLIVDRRSRIDVVELETGRALRTLVDLPTSEDDVRGMALSPDGRSLVTSDNAGRVRVIDPRGGAPARDLLTLGGYALELAFLSGGAELLLADMSGDVHVVDFRSGAVRRTFAFGPDTVKALAVERSGRFAHIGVLDRVQRFDLETGVVVAVTHAGVEVRALELSRNGRTLWASGGWLRGRLLELDPTTLERRRLLAGHGKGVLDVAARPVPGGPGDVALVSVDRTGELRTWRDGATAGARVLAAGYDVLGVAASADGEALALVTRWGRARVLDSTTLEWTHEFELATGAPRPATGASDARTPADVHAAGREQFGGVALGDGVLLAASDRLHRVELATGAIERGPVLPGRVHRLRLGGRGEWLVGVDWRADALVVWRLPDLEPARIVPFPGVTDVVRGVEPGTFLALTRGAGVARFTPVDGRVEPAPDLDYALPRAGHDGRAVRSELAREWVGANGARDPERLFVCGLQAAREPRLFVSGSDDRVRIVGPEGRELLVLDDAPKAVTELVEASGGRVFGLSRLPGSPSYLVVWDRGGDR